MKVLGYLVFSALLSMSAISANAKDQNFDKGYQAEIWEDYKTALSFYHISADDGNADAMKNIGRFYYSGFGVSKDYVQAMRWMRLAAEHENADAQWWIGYMYEFADIFPGITDDNARDYVRAYMWYNIAAANGDREKASEWRDGLTKVLSKNDIARAQEMSTECMSSGYKNCGD